ncbi:hypothetical protein WJX72_008445 [[Myrmecia] bisecta]|uniref:Mediator of RNA polymerase II transcription subunit 20 n=1 Tax=[Myrmecia] bisecta TaxID=41462 RepID=A0AAW1QSG3_9CHLO
MGVKRVLRWQHPGAYPGRQDFETLGAALESLKGSNRRRWAAACQGMRVMQGQEDAASVREAAKAKEVYMVTFSSDADAVFLVMRQERQIIRAERSIRELLEKVNMLKQRFMLYFEGWQCSLGDFVVKLGKATQKPNDEFKGIVMEVDYLPLASPQQAQHVLKEFVEILQAATTSAGGRLELVSAPLAEYPLPERFGMEHTAVLYTALCSSLLSQAR